MKSARLPVIRVGGVLAGNSQTLVKWRLDLELRAQPGEDRGRRIKKIQEQLAEIEVGEEV
jgi:hypothetical protein